MKRFFDHCFTLEEIKEKYRLEAKVLHPDAGGEPADFRELKSQYDEALKMVSKKALLPELFVRVGKYKYQWVQVNYVTRDNHYYHFTFMNGGRLQITGDRTDLIFTDRGRL
jgi:hypothetical protein